MLFVSNRPGGYGGFDIWRSEYLAGSWSSPVNVGDSINTSANENRPVLVGSEGYINKLLLFSSDRPGGAGGYDVYYCGY